MHTTRREFIRDAGTCVLTAAALPQLIRAAPAESKTKPTPTLIAVYLRGGTDAIGTIVPFADKHFAGHRPNLAMPGPDSKSTSAVLPLDEQFGFNPNMKELHALYEKGLCVPIMCVGSPHATRSHFDAQDFMERGAPGQRNVVTGWLNRYLGETRTSRDSNLRAISLQSLLPRSLRGDYPVLAKPDDKAELAMVTYRRLYPHMNPKMPEKGEAFGQKTRESIKEFGSRTIEQLWELNEILEKSPPPLARYPDSGFGRQMRDIAKVIKAKRGLEITALDYGGWDHHIDEGPVNGQLGKKLDDVSGTLGAFVADLGPKVMENVCVLVMSEFGRTVKENGNKGTDHGHGGCMLVVGGPLQGKKVYGKWTGLSEDKLYERRDLPVHTDFRVVFAETLKGVFKFDGIKEGLFPDYSPDSPPLDLMRSA